MATGIAAAQPVAQGFGPQSLARPVREVALEVVGIAVTEGPHAGGPPSARRRSFATSPAPLAGSRLRIYCDTGQDDRYERPCRRRGSQHRGTLNDGERFLAKFVGCDPLTDIAVIKVRSQRSLIPIHHGSVARGRLGVAVEDVTDAAGMPAKGAEITGWKRMGGRPKSAWRPPTWCLRSMVRQFRGPAISSAPSPRSRPACG